VKKGCSKRCSNRKGKSSGWLDGKEGQGERGGQVREGGYKEGVGDMIETARKERG